MLHFLHYNKNRCLVIPVGSVFSNIQAQSDRQCFLKHSAHFSNTQTFPGGAGLAEPISASSAKRTRKKPYRRESMYLSYTLSVSKYRYHVLKQYIHICDTVNTSKTLHGNKAHGRSSHFVTSVPNRCMCSRTEPTSLCVASIHRADFLCKAARGE
jgi:hypothetical protein